MHHKQKHQMSPKIEVDASHRWLLPVLLVAQLMVILDITAVNIALPHIARDLALGSEHQLGDHELLADLRQPAPLRRPRRRSARASASPDRPRCLHRLVVRLGDGRERRRAARRPRGPGTRRRDALAGRSVDRRVGVPRRRPRQGARSVGCDRRGRRGDRRPRRRRSDRVHRLADDLLRQPARRSRTHGRSVEGRAGRFRKAALARARPRGAALATTSLAAIVYAITQAESAAGRRSRRTCAASVGSPASRPSRCTVPLDAPLLRVDRIADRAVGGGLVLMLAAAGSIFGLFLLCSLYLQNVLGLGALSTGLAFIPLAIRQVSARTVPATRRQARHPRPARFRVRSRRRRDAASVTRR